ncbi:MAG: VWA domain-containing protein [Chloroflexi bacterium]|nr:VWA domain-containing protein [Chloroflexota bacterium]
MADLDYYGLLAISPHASSDEIKAAYRRFARRLHPDANRNSPGAAAQFQSITQAYETLLDPVRRQRYDEETLRIRTGKGKNNAYFTLRVTPSRQSLTPLDDPQVMYLLAEIAADPRIRDEVQKRESNLNLTLVLDRSNSMNGTRLDKVKVAAHQIIDNLTPKDILSVVTFNDRQEVIIPATYVSDKPALKARVSLMSASGGTEIFHGLSSGVEQNRKYLGPRLVNRVILLTDGHTFGDQERCLELAKEAHKDGIGISAMGLGHDWNDEFLDKIASTTGGTSAYIDSAGAVVRFLNEHVRQLSYAFAERVGLSIAPDPDIVLESAFKLSPNPQPLTIEEGFIPVGSLQANRAISVLFQLQVPAGITLGFRSLARIMANGDILTNEPQAFQALSDISVDVVEEPQPDNPPANIMDALGKLTLYKMQERAREALERGDVAEATRRLENLATRLLDMGEEELANQALAEARRVAHTSNLSDRGSKTLRFHTRYLLAGSVTEDNS